MSNKHAQASRFIRVRSQIQFGGPQMWTWSLTFTTSGQRRCTEELQLLLQAVASLLLYDLLSSNSLYKTVHQGTEEFWLLQSNFSFWLLVITRVMKHIILVV